MSMITDQRGWLGRFGRSAGVIAGLHALILTAYIALTLVPGTAQAVTVIMPKDSLRTALPRNVSVISWGMYTAQLASNDPDFVRQLYKAGAVLVLPTLDAFCLSLNE
jgi:hypothetical protein